MAEAQNVQGEKNDKILERQPGAWSREVLQAILGGVLDFILGQ